MKKIILCTLVLIISAFSFSQQTTSPTAATTDYLKKSKNQQTIAWILVGSGVSLVVIAAATSGKAIANSIFLGDNRGINTSSTLLVLGGTITLSSVPFFIVSGRNKRKSMSLSFKNETISQLQKTSLVYRPVPSLILKIKL